MSFETDIAKFAAKTNYRLGQVSRAVKISLFGGIIRDTRVDTGRLRGNWQTSVGQSVSGELERYDKLPQGQGGGEAMREMERTVTPDNIDYLTNNLSYARKWDSVDGTIDKNMVRIERNVREAVASVK